MTFTIPGQLCRLLFEINYEAEQMITLTAGIYKSFLQNATGVKGKGQHYCDILSQCWQDRILLPQFQPGILATLHKSGNSLNFNPHCHLISTQELVDTKTGEIIEISFLPYKKIRFIWQKAFLQHLMKQGIITEEEQNFYKERYKNGFHVYFQPITGTDNDVLFRTAQYIATGFFHNSQITAVNHHKKTITFKYRKYMERGTRKKHYAEKTINIFSFMARMLFFFRINTEK